MRPKCGKGQMISIRVQKKSFKIACAEPLPVVRERLGAALTTDHPSWFSEPTFHGTVENAGFRIMRNRPRNHFGYRMVAIGHFITNDGGTIVEVTMYSSDRQLALCAAAILCVIFLLRTRHFHWILILFLAGGMAYLWFVTFVYCAYERRLYRYGLTRILNGN